jgi:hypothetical protein
MNHCKYSVKDTLTPLPASVTACATIDESGREQIVTDVMIHRACEMMDADQLWPITGVKRSPHSALVAPVCGATILPFAS